MTGVWARRCLRAPLLFIHILAGIIIALLVLPAHPENPVSTRPMVIWSRLLCRILGVIVRVNGSAAQGTALFVANHISWLDIFCIASVCPTHFLAKSEVADWPVFGWLCRRAGTAFIKRGNQNGAAEAVECLSRRLSRGERMLIFPEGTSTTGETVKRFYPRLFQAAIQSRCPVQAIALRYPDGSGLNTVVPFVDEDSFLPHLWRLLGESATVAEIHFGLPTQTRGHSRDALAIQTHGQISALLGLATGNRCENLQAAAVN